LVVAWCTGLLGLATSSLAERNDTVAGTAFASLVKCRAALKQRKKVLELLKCQTPLGENEGGEWLILKEFE
jgi:hypothetical protein